MTTQIPDTKEFLESDPADGAHREALERTWSGPGGFRGWLTSVDHKSIAKRYLITAFVWFALAGVNAALIRLQLIRPEMGLIGPTGTTRCSRCTARP
jgi:hypothetical protein